MLDQLFELEPCACIPEDKNICASCQKIDDCDDAVVAEQEAVSARMSPAERASYDAERAARQKLIRYTRKNLDTNGNFKVRYEVQVPDPLDDGEDIVVPLSPVEHMAMDAWVRRNDGRMPETLNIDLPEYSDAS